jgi:hypothetical protein
MRTTTFILALSQVALGVHAQTNIYVSPSGADNNTGTSTSPLLSIAAAQKAARAAVASSSGDVNVNLGPGVYPLSAPLVLTAADSGTNGHKVNWLGSGATLSGGLKVSGWTAGSNGIYSASVPAGTKSRNLYVNGKAAQYARRKITRNDFRYNNQTMTWTSSNYDFFQTMTGVANGGEIRFIDSFTDRYAPIASVGNRQLTMKQPAWSNNLIGYDMITGPNAEEGVWAQNILGLLDSGGQYYLDSAAGKVYYKPLNGEDINTLQAYLAVQEVLVAFAGTYDSPVHDITFQNVSFAHATWNFPTNGGYVDQQTGGHICVNQTYTVNFEATRPMWCQMPSAVQLSAAKNITISGANFTQLGAGGIGIGNDANAHLSGVGLGVSDIAVQDNYFSQVMGNSVTAGGIRADAHHPSDARMVVTRLTIQNNIFFNNSVLFSSTVPILATYFQYSTIAHNDLYILPYSGICYGYGWGSNDAGGGQEYQNRGLYNYQPKYSTPTTLQNNQVTANLIHSFGQTHTDLGALYTLSKSPSTYITQNYVYDSGAYCLYNDEGSNSYIETQNDCFNTGVFNAQNNDGGNINTGNLTVTGNWGPNANNKASSPQAAGVDALRVAYRAGVTPGHRTGRPVSNSASIPDGFLAVARSGSALTLTISNFDDVDFTGVSITLSPSLTASSVPSTIPANSNAQAKYTGASGTVSATVKYTNPRTGASRTLTGSA